MSTATETLEAAAEPALVFTESAAVKVSELIREEGNPNLKLRVFVSGGGCSGFQYGFTFDENEEEGDTCVEKQGQGRSRGRAVRDPQSERRHHLRLRVVLLGLSAGWSATRPPCPTSSPLSTSGRTAST